MTDREAALLRSFGFTPEQKREVFDAYLEHPGGLIDCAIRAHNKGVANGDSGAGLLISMIRAGDHAQEDELAGQRITGFRFVRGTHSGTYVRDPLGTDVLPLGFEVPPWPEEQAKREKKAHRQKGPVV